MKKKIAFFFATALIALLFVFVVQNLQDVELRFLGWGGEITLAGPIVIAYIFGGLTARPVWRFLNAQRVQRKTDKKAEKAAEAKLQNSVSAGSVVAGSQAADTEPKSLSGDSATNS